MLKTWEGKRIKANGFRSIQAVKAQFKKAGHEPKNVADLVLIEDDSNGTINRWFWQCSCGAKLSFAQKGKRFFDLSAW